MHSLETIERLNAKEAARATPAREAGKWVVGSYAGLALVGVTSYDTQADAQAFADNARRTAAPDQHYSVLPPFTPSQL